MFLADHLLDLLLQWLDAPIIKQAAGEVARECRAALWHHVHKRIHGMSLAQARGYIRAVAPSFVGNEVDVVLSRRRASGHIRPQVVALAIEEVIDLLSDDIIYSAAALDMAAIAA
jgi:hypothetical protein